MDSARLERSPLSADAVIQSDAVIAAEARAGETPPRTQKWLRTCESAEGLNAIATPEVELVIWRRGLPRGFQDWLAQLEESLLPHIRILVRPEDTIKALEPLLSDCGMPEGALRSLLICDVRSLVATFARITGSKLVDVRLERVSDDACWKFHRDCVEARLLTTYRGSTTEWVLPENAEAALRSQADYKGPLEQMGDNDVAIFKGSCAGPGSGIVHRSPHIAGTGQTRLLLCLNKRSAVSPEPWSE